MRKKGSLFTIGAAVLLGGCMLFGLFGCGAKTYRADQDVSLEVKTDSSMSGGIPEVQEYHLDNVLDAFSWHGKTAEEIGIAEEYVDGHSISFKGSLFDSEVRGNAYLLYHSEREADLVDRIFLTCRDLSFTDAIARFTELYGLPYDTGEEPYAEVNGGAVEWQRFYTGAETVTVSQASNYDFFTIDVIAETLPGRYKESPDQPEISETDATQNSET